MTGKAIAAGKIAVLLALMVPWLNPFAGGPTPSVFPWLIAAACAVIVWSMRSCLTVQLVTVGWLAAAAASSVIAIMQFFGQTDAWGMWVNSAQLGEAYANLRQRNQFATLTSIGLLVAIWNAVQHDRPPQTTATCTQSSRGKPLLRWFRHVVVVMVVVVLAIGNAASGSRTGLLQWIITFAATLQWRRRGEWRATAVALAALTAYGIATVGLPWLLELLNGVQTHGALSRFTEGRGCQSRFVLWSNVLYLIGQKPWMGWGWGELDFVHFVTSYPGERFCDILDNAHNLPLHLAVELGVPFAIFTCGGLLWGALRHKPWRETDPSRQLAWGVLTVIALHSLLEYPLWYGPFQIATVLGVGLLWQPLPFKAPKNPVKSAFIAIVCIACITWVGFDYWRVSQLYLPLAERNRHYRDDTLNKVRGSWLFSSQVAFAELTTTTVTQDNASKIYAIGLRLLHFSPEPKVVEKLIDSAVISGRDDEAAYYLVRYRAAFPDACKRWMADSAGYETP